MAGRNPEEERLLRPIGEIARIKRGDLNLPPVIIEDPRFNKLLEQLEDASGYDYLTKRVVLSNFCQTGGPERFVEFLEKIKRGAHGQTTLLAIFLDARGYMINNEPEKLGEFGNLKGKFAEHFIASCLNFMLQEEGLRVLFPQEVTVFLRTLPEQFRGTVDGIFLKPQVNLTQIVGVGEYKAVGSAQHFSVYRQKIPGKLDFQKALYEFLLSQEGKEYSPELEVSLPPDLPRKIEVDPKDFSFYWVVTEGPVGGREMLKKKNVKILQIPFKVGELDRMAWVLLHDYCLTHQIIMEL